MPEQKLKVEIISHKGFEVVKTSFSFVTLGENYFRDRYYFFSVETDTGTGTGLPTEIMYDVDIIVKKSTIAGIQRLYINEDELYRVKIMDHYGNSITHFDYKTREEADELTDEIRKWLFSEPLPGILPKGLE